jgi:hypothetical protein
MAYLDAPSIDPARIAMPLRTFGWLDAHGDPDTAALAAHAAQWPAAAKPIDEFTAAIVQSTTADMADDGSDPATIAARGADLDDDPDELDELDDSDGREVEDVTTVPDPDPSIVAGLDDPITDDPDEDEWTFTRPETTPLTAAQAREALRERITAWQRQGVEDFATGDLRDLWADAGLTRQWAQNQLRKLRTAGVIGYDDTTQRHLILDTPTADTDDGADVEDAA